MQAESIGDQIGSNDTAIANAAYRLAGQITEAMKDHPFTLGKREDQSNSD